MEENKVIYFPVKFFPSYLELNRLQELQFTIKHTIQQIEHVEKNRYNMIIRKQGLANRLRSTLHIVNCDNDYPEQFIKGTRCSESGIFHSKN